MKLAERFGREEDIKKYLVENYNACEGIEIEGKPVGIADYYPSIRRNIERLSGFLARTERGEGTLISCSANGSACEILVLTEIVGVTGLTPYSSVFYKGRVEFNEVGEKSAFYNPYPHLSHCCWCMLDYIIPPGDSTKLLTSPKTLEKISEEELRKFEQSLETEEGLLAELQTLYVREKKRKIFEVEKVYV